MTTFSGRIIFSESKTFIQNVPQGGHFGAWGGILEPLGLQSIILVARGRYFCSSGFHFGRPGASFWSPWSPLEPRAIEGSSEELRKGFEESRATSNRSNGFRVLSKNFEQLRRTSSTLGHHRRAWSGFDGRRRASKGSDESR